MESKLHTLIELLIEKIDEEFTLEGHPNTGGFQESLEGEITTDGNNILVNIWASEYGLYLSSGVEPDNVPYSRGQGSGGTSRYITGLHNWVKTKLGIGDEREALGIAFAIANSHAEEGFPLREGTPGSGFLDEVNKKHADELTILIEEIYDEIIQKKLTKDQ